MMSDETKGSVVTPRTPRYRSLSASSLNTRFTSSTVVSRAARATMSASDPTGIGAANLQYVQVGLIQTRERKRLCERRFSARRIRDRMENQRWFHGSLLVRWTAQIAIPPTVARDSCAPIDASMLTQLRSIVSAPRLHRPPALKARLRPSQGLFFPTIARLNSRASVSP